ncbi:MAG: OmpH family outer membrane protein [bacterium]|nr:OmpH family outer membrane protein [bacterium]
MRSISKIILTLFAALILTSAAAEFVNAQGTKMGFVNDERIKMEYRAWQKAQEQWELEAKAWEEEAIAKQEELREMEEEYDKQKLILSEEKKKEKEAAIKVKSDDLDAYTRRVFGPNGEAERKQASLLQPLLDNVTAAIEAVAVEETYDVIFTLQSGLGYINPTLDITDKVLKYLEENEG